MNVIIQPTTIQIVKEIFPKRTPLLRMQERKQGETKIYSTKRRLFAKTSSGERPYDRAVSGDNLESKHPPTFVS